MAPRRKTPKAEKKPKKPGNSGRKPNPEPKKPQRPKQNPADPGPVFESIAKFYPEAEREDNLSLYLISWDLQPRADQAEDGQSGPGTPPEQTGQRRKQRRPEDDVSARKRGPAPKSRGGPKTGKRSKGDDADGGPGGPPPPWRFR